VLAEFLLIKALLAYSSQGAMVLLWLADYREICNMQVCARCRKREAE
jgi:hypothetical protein